MPAKPKPTIESLRRQVAEAEATLGALRAKLARLEAKESGGEVPVCGLDLLWDAALPMSRQRSSRQRCRQAWSRLPASARPAVVVAVAALQAWNRCDQWRSNDNLYAPGLHRFISERMWESLPEKSKATAPLQRNMSSPAPAVQGHQADAVTDQAEIARLLGRPIVTPRATRRGDHGPADIASMLGLPSSHDFPSLP